MVNHHGHPLLDVSCPELLHHGPEGSPPLVQLGSPGSISIRPLSHGHNKNLGPDIQEPLLDWKVVCYQMAIAKLAGDLWMISQIGRSSDTRLSSSPPGLISSDSRGASTYT